MRKYAENLLGISYTNFYYIAYIIKIEDNNGNNILYGVAILNIAHLFKILFNKKSLSIWKRFFYRNLFFLL